MSPHALSVSDSDSVRSESVGSDSRPDLEGVPESLLQRFPDNEVHDLVCVGFGPASLAIAVALHDALDLNASQLSTRTPKVRFLEKQEQFAWHAGMLLPGAKMQITFVKDMATLRNPRSEYTFLNYLHQNNRLVDFTNLGTFLPQRIEYEDYMRWCAAHFSSVADYSQDVQKIEIGKVNPATGSIENFQISSVDHRTSRLTKLYAKNVIIAAGGRPNIPKPLPEYHPRILHSSQYATRVHKLFPEGTSPKKVVVIGGGQSAAEVWYNIPERFPGAQSLLVIRGAALKPSDDSPFVNEVFNPSRVSDIYSQSPSIRSKLIAHDKATNYGVVRLELLEEIYAQQYAYKIQRLPEESWPHRILSHRNLVAVSDAKNGKGLRLELQDDSHLYCAGRSAELSREIIDADLVIVATGYVRNAHEEMLAELRDFMPGGASEEGKKWTVGRDYAVQFEEGSVAPDARIFLQGCNEQTHGLADSLLSILSVRGGEIVESVFAQGGAENVAIA